MQKRIDAQNSLEDLLLEGLEKSNVCAGKLWESIQNRDETQVKADIECLHPRKPDFKEIKLGQKRDRYENIANQIEEEIVNYFRSDKKRRLRLFNLHQK